jgi:hypothetical protein
VSECSWNGCMDDRMMEGMMVRMMEGMMVRMMENELSPNNMYACPQLDTCHVGSYFGPLVLNFGT